MDDLQAHEAGWGDTDRHPLMLPLLALVTGITLARWQDVVLELWLLLVCGALAGWLLTLRSGRRKIAFGCLLCGWLTLGGAAVQSHWRLFAADDLGLAAVHSGQPVCVIVHVHTAPQKQDGRDRWSGDQGPVSRWMVRVQSVRDGRHWRVASGLVAVRLRGTLREDLWPGDELVLWAKLYRPRPPANPGQPDRGSWNRAQRVLCHLHVAGAEAVYLQRRGSSLSARRWIEALRSHCRGLFRRYVDSAQEPLAAALLLGMRQQLPDDVMLAFLQTGTIHILAISGLHLGMLVWMVWLLARAGWLSRRAALWMALAFVAPYAVLTGAQPPVVRAASLAMCLSGGRLLSRPAQGWNLLAASGLAVLLLQPLGVFQIGVQLSFLAVATLGHCRHLGAARPLTDPLARLLLRSRSPLRRRIDRSVRAALALWGTSLIVWIISLPLIVYWFHVASPIAVLLNPLLWLPIALALLSGFGVLLLGDLLPPAAWICGQLCGQALQWAEQGILRCQGFPLGYLWMPGPPLVLVLVFYSCAGAWSAFPRWRPAKQFTACIVLAWFAAWCLHLGEQHWANQRGRQLRITFFAVGHGTCVLMELPGGQTMLYDCGRLGRPHGVAASVAHEVWARGRFGIDVVVISHADADHFNALGPLLERVRVHQIFSAPHVLRSRSPLLKSLRQLADARHVRWEMLDDRRQLPMRSPVRMRVLHPPPEELQDSDNANSVVLAIEYANRRVLLPGDLEGQGLARLLSGPPLASDVLLAPHHGSVLSDPPTMTRWSRPRWIVLSSKSHPAAVWLHIRQQYSAEILDTSTHNAIRCDIERCGRIHWSCWDGKRWQLRSSRDTTWERRRIRSIIDGLSRSADIS